MGAGGYHGSKDGFLLYYMMRIPLSGESPFFLSPNSPILFKKVLAKFPCLCYTSICGSWLRAMNPIKHAQKR